MPSERLPPVFTLAFDDPPQRLLELREWWAANLIVFQCHVDGRVTVDGFPDETVINETIAARYAALAPGMLYFRGERLYIHASSGEAVYVPVGPSHVRLCTRYGRLYRRP